jgi:quercetin dioxygenase-like cupin family protein
MSVYPDFGAAGEGGISYTSASADWRHGQNMSIGYLKMEAGSVSSPHYHEDEQFIYLLKGEVRVAIDGKIIEVSTGSLVHFPPGTIHEISVSGNVAAEFILSRGPAREYPDNDVFTPEGEAAQSVFGK